jgi:ABC-type bacteriocin/lantibiotic exporter with double-glycine peptidase domain
MQMKYISHIPGKPRSLVQKTVAIIATVVLAIVALMFSAVLLAVVLSVGVVVFAYLWWKTRELRKLMRNSPPPQAANDVFAGETSRGEVIEGEVVRPDDSRPEGKR